MNRTLALLTLTLITLALLGVAAHDSAANGPEIGYSGKSIFPLRSEKVQLVSEKVRVSMPYGMGFGPRNHNRVFCEYRLRNLTDSPVTFDMAFAITDTAHIDFRAQLDGKNLPITRMVKMEREWESFADQMSALLPVWTVSIASRGEVQLTCSYGVSWGGHLYHGWDQEDFTYIATPAALWAGPIETADFEIDLGDRANLFMCKNGDQPPYVRTKISPPDYQWNGSRLTWHYENWEPTMNFRLVIHRATFEERDACLVEAGGDDDEPRYMPLPVYAGSAGPYERQAILEQIGERYRYHQGAHILPNYIQFARCYLETLALEIEARRGREFASYDAWGDYFRRLAWYQPRSTYDPADLTETERANQTMLRAMQDEIARDPSVLVPREMDSQ